MPANSDDTVTATEKRKQAKRSSDEQDPADLRQPKDPDPVDPVKLVEAEVKAILGDSITVTYLRNLCNDAVDEIGQGNERFRAFQDRYASKFSQPCLYFDDVFKTATEVVSCEELMTDIFKMQENNTQFVIQLLVGLINPEEGEDIDDPYVWAIRELVMRVAQQDPTQFFKIKEARDNVDSVAMRSFWDRSDGSEFRLRTDTIAVRFWIIASCLLGHPWRYYFHITPDDPANPRELEFPAGSTPMSEAAQMEEVTKKKLTPLEKQAIAFQKYFSQKNKDGSDRDSNQNRVGKILDFESMGVTTSTVAKAQTKSKKQKKRSGNVQFKDVVSKDMKSAEETSTRNKRKEKEKIVEAKSPDRSRQKADDGSKQATAKSQESARDGATKDDDSSIEVTGVIQGLPDGYSSEEDDEIEVTGTKKPSMELEDADATGDVMMEKEEAEKEGTKLASRPVQEASYAEAVKRQGSQTPTYQTIAQKVKNLTQVDVTGMPGLAWFFEMVFAMNWNGNQSGKSITKAWVKQIVDVLVEAIKNSEDGLRLLPFSDEHYKDRKLWIRNELECREKIKTFRDLQKYLDMDYGNAPYTASNNKPGDKTFRTRMRFGFDTGVKHQNVQAYLNDGLRSMGSKAGCHATPIQWGYQRRIGGLAFLPPEMNPRLYAKELMRELGFEVPIVLVWEWVNVPFDSSRMKWNERQPGIRLWHVYVRADDAYKVDLKLRKWLHPDTEKKDLPWAAPTHYFSDWKTIEADVLSVKPCGLAKDKVLILISRARDFQNLTTVLFSDSEFSGMLKKSKTTNFDDCSLLKMLLSIKASPDQAALAANNPGGTSDAESMEDDTTTEDKGFKMVKKKQSKKEMEQAVATASKDMTPAQVKAEADREKKLLLDASNFVPSPLFLMVLPGEMEGTYILVVRLKYEQLGRNVLGGIVAFFVCHLGEPSQSMALQVIKPWFSQTLIERFKRRRQSWCLQTARAIDGVGQSDGALDAGLDFLEFGADILDSFRGLLAFDLEMANAKDIDDGATVAGAMDDFLDAQAKMNAALQKAAISEERAMITEIALGESEEALAKKIAENEALMERMIRMEAVVAEERRRWAQKLQLAQQVPPGSETALSDIDSPLGLASDGPPSEGKIIEQTVHAPLNGKTDVGAEGVATVQSPPPVTRNLEGLTQRAAAAVDRSAGLGFEPLGDEESESESHVSSPPMHASRPDTGSKLVSPDNETGLRGANGGSTVT